MAAPRPFTDLNEPVFRDKNNKRLGRSSTILSSGLHQIWRLFTKLYSAVYVKTYLYFRRTSVNMSRKNYKKCRYCQKNYARSKEHIIVNSRLDSLNKFKNLTQRNDNIRKTYKNITCTECNHILGEYESKNWICLANATIWKILAGNTNSAFEEDSEYILKHSDERCIKNFENVLLTVIKSTNLALQDNTFTFNIDHKNG